MLPGKIISGGQSGVDTAALLAAKNLGIATGGWSPPEVNPEKLFIFGKYGLRETPQDRSTLAPSIPRSLRTQWNVRDADASLVLTMSKHVNDPGTQFTVQCIKYYQKPSLLVNISEPGHEKRIMEWLTQNHFEVLNIAGPSEISQPGIQSHAFRLLMKTFYHLQASKHE